MSETWKIFQKDQEPHQGIKNLPEPPPWPNFSQPFWLLYL